ncbi:MAG: hypothetical protein AAF957_01895 [Planctomycetota bacterium]
MTTTGDDGAQKKAPAKKRRASAKLPALEPLVPWDFEALRAPRSRSADYNEQRLASRRRLEAVAKHLAQRAKDRVALEVRTSIHNPFPPVNGGRVERLWAYATRPKAAKTKLRRVIGAELAKDLDHAYRNGYLCVALEAEAVEVSFRIHADAWYDGRNLVRRLDAEGLKPLLGLLNELDGFRLQLADWKGEWRCGGLQPEQLEEFMGFYEPGEHLFAVQRRWPAPEAAREALTGDDVPATLVSELERLVEVYRYAMWSSESDFLFG